MKKILSIKFSEEKKQTLKRKAVAYLNSLCKIPQSLDDALMADGVLSARFKTEGSYLQEPGSIVFEAHYLASGRAILYSIDEDSNLPMIFFVWEADSIIIMHKEFMENLPSGDYYIEVVADAEIVTITNFCRESFYRIHPVAYEITAKILTMKKARMFLQMSICLKPYKNARRAAMDKKFPGLRKSLSNQQVCAFIGIRPSTLGNSK